VSHLEQEQLVLLALGEATADDAEAAHVDACAACRAELQALRTVATVGREATDARHLTAPPDRVWDGIAAALASAPAPAVPLRPEPQRRARRPRWLVPALSAAAAAAVAVAGTIIAERVTRDEPTAQPQVLGLASLDRLPAAPECGPTYARTFIDGRLHVHLGCVATPGETFEVWLLDLSTANDPDGLKMFTLGVMGGQTDQIFRLRSDIDLNRFKTVDVSAEPNDGRPAHSGKSLWRGPLPGR